MSRLSETVIKGNGIPDKQQEELKTCFFCGKKITKGGCWAGIYHLGVCQECSASLVDLLVDTLDDTDTAFEQSDIKEKEKRIGEIVMERVAKKDEKIKKLQQNVKYQFLKKMGIRFYCEVGIIDFFECTMTLNEAINKLNGHDLYDEETLRGCGNDIKEFINSISGEYPHTIRFFAIPDLNYGMFKLACVAKIQNNGSTYILCDNEEYFDGFEEQVYIDVNSIY